MYRQELEPVEPKYFNTPATLGLGLHPALALGSYSTDQLPLSVLSEVDLCCQLSLYK